MAGRWQVGKAPDSDSSELNKGYVDAQMQAMLVTNAYVNSQIALAGQSLVTPTYVNNGDSQVAQKTAVDNADLNYLNASTLGAASGVASLDNTGEVTAAQIPSNVPLEYPVLSYNAATDGTINLGSAASHTVTTSTLREFQLANIVIPDPGYPWVAIPLGMVQGGDPTATSVPDRNRGTGNFGLLSVMQPAGVSDTVYGVGLCTATYRNDFYKIIPYATTNQTPAPIHGGATLGLYGCCWTGQEYTYTGAGLVYWVLVLPSVGG